MVRARIDGPKIKFPTQPLPKPPLDHCPPGHIGGIIPKETINKLVDGLEFAKKDANHDNSLNSTELYGRPFGEMAQVEKLQRYDANHDGKVDRDEYHAGRNAERATEKSKIDLPIFKKVGGIGEVAGEAAGKVEKTVGEAAGKVFDAINPF